MTTLYVNAMALLSDDRLEQARHSDLGALSLAEAIGHLLIIRQDLNAFEQTDPGEIPTPRLNTVEQYRDNALPGLLDEMIALDPQGPNFQSERVGLIQRAREIKDALAENIRPFLSATARDALAAKAQYDELTRQLNDRLQEATTTIEELKTSSVQAGARTISGHYGDAADTHKTAARNFLAAAGAAAGVLIVLVILLFWAYPPPTKSGSSGWEEFVKELGGRLLILAAAGGALAFATRNYRVNKHLQTVNETRRNALDTFVLFVAGATDDTRNIVTAELVHAIFSAGDTGYMSTDREQMIIENPGSLLGVLGSIKQG